MNSLLRIVGLLVVLYAAGNMWVHGTNDPQYALHIYLFVGGMLAMIIGEGRSRGWRIGTSKD